MRLTRVLGSALVVGALLSSPGFAQDVLAGRKIAAGICQSCHGLDGLAKMPEVPNLAAMDETYLNRQLQAFRSGARQNELMSAVLPMLDDRKIADVAAYYHAIEVQVTKVPGKS